MTDLRRFIWKKARGLILLSILGAALSGICRAGLIGLVNTTLSGGYVPGWSYILLCVMAPLLSVGAELITIETVNEAMFQTLLSVVRNLLKAPLRKVEDAGAPMILTILTQDLSIVTGGLHLIPIVVLQISIVAGSLGYLMWLSPRVFFTVMVFIALGALSFRLTYTLAQKHLNTSRLRAEDIFRHLDTLVRGLKELKLNLRRQQRFLEKNLTGSALAFKKHSLAGSAIFSLSGNWNQLLFFLVIGFLLFIAPHWWSIDKQLTSGYGLTLLFITGPLTALAGTAGNVGGIVISFSRLERMSSQLHTDESAAGSEAETAPAWAEIQMRDVAYSYRSNGDDQPFTVGPIDLTIKKGELLFLVGGNGCGKTTLAKIICGLYEADQGEILIDGIGVKKNMTAYRQLFGAVFTDFVLFDDILDSAPPDFDARLEKHLKEFELETKVGIADGVFSTTALSHGQRKRLALLVQCLEDRPILILDEWAADQDPTFKKLFYREILPSLKQRNKTVIVITHDDTYFDAADRLVKLDYGKIVHQEFLALASTHTLL